jgi:hypothetical protein
MDWSDELNCSYLTEAHQHFEAALERDASARDTVRIRSDDAPSYL